MPWPVNDLVSVRFEFVQLALQKDCHIRELCRRFDVSATVAYKWLRRFRSGGKAALADQSRRPHRSPKRTATDIEALIVGLRRENPAWGARKLRRRLLDLGHTELPATSTMTDILHRHDLIGDAQSQASRRYQRFERSAPNELWQIDYKGHIGLSRGRCHPLCALDDHSRYNVVLEACADQKEGTVRGHLIEAFRRYGLPTQVLWDNGAPWGSGGGQEFTALDVWLMRLGVGVIHGQPYHPQTQGKEERFHRTLKAEVLDRGAWQDCHQVQRAFNCWRPVYNQQRPHEALGLATPASRYQLSQRCYPEELPQVQYDHGIDVRRVCAAGWINYRGKPWKVGRAFVGQTVGVRPTDRDGICQAIFLTHVIKELDMRKTTTAVPSTDAAP
jgi:transposase InsO family protein